MEKNTRSVTTERKTGEFSRGKETTNQWYYYETIALLMLFHQGLQEKFYQGGTKNDTGPP